MHRREYDIQELVELCGSTLQLDHEGKKKLLYWMSRAWDSGFAACKETPEPPRRPTSRMKIQKP